MAVCLQLPAANCQDIALRKIGSTSRFRQLLPGLTRSLCCSMLSNYNVFTFERVRESTVVEIVN